MPQRDTNSPIARNRRERLLAWALLLLVLALAAILSWLAIPTETQLATRTSPIDHHA